MKKLILVLMLSWSGDQVLAADISTTKRECLSKCGEFKGGAPSERFNAKMKVIDEKKALETDPIKLETLKQEAERETDRYEREHEKMCHAICDGNPDN